MPKRKFPQTLEPTKRKYVAISKAVKNEIREMIKTGFSKSEVEARLQKEKKIEGEINITQWKTKLTIYWTVFMLVLRERYFFRN